jgi:rod shape-determining protein MreC
VALGADRYGTRADLAAFVTCLVLSLTALALPEGLREPISSTLRETVLAPVLGVERRSVHSAENRSNLDALRAQRDSLALGAADLPELAAENARLRGLLGLGGRLTAGFVNAEVLHQAGATDGLTLVLSAGSADSVSAFAPVVTPEGLVGMVRTVDRHTSIAMAWTHPDFRASAMVEGTQIYGIVAARRGERSGEIMELRGVAYRDQLAPGTRVVTSGLGGIFPRGVPLGTVHAVLSEAAGWERTYLLQPAVHPAEASHVLVLLPDRAADTLTAAFKGTLPADTSRQPPVTPPTRPRP